MSCFTNDIFTKFKKDGNVEDKLAEEYIEYIEKSKCERIIDLFQVTTAYGLNHYFINQKLILAGFPKAGETIETRSTHGNINELPVDNVKPVDSIERKLLLLPGPFVFLTTCSSKHISNKMEFEIVAKKLQVLKLGVYGKKKLNVSSKPSVCFTKMDPKNEKNDTLEIINNLLGFFISFEDFEQAYDADGSQ